MVFEIAFKAEFKAYKILYPLALKPIKFYTYNIDKVKINNIYDLFIINNK